MNDSQQRILGEIKAQFEIQLPDLLVYTPDGSRFWFAEVKGPGDSLRLIQKASHQAIRKRLGVPVEVITVRQQAATAAALDTLLPAFLDRTFHARQPH